MSDHVLCTCERGRYNPDHYTSCYECYQERAEGMASCVYCGRWHSQEYGTCYRCRTQHHRDEAGRAIRTYIEWRDEYRCRNCGTTGVINIDHIQPCRHGGGAALWNLQVLCDGCNRVKGATWIPGGPWSQIRRGLYAYYSTTGRQWLDDTQRGYAPDHSDAKDAIRDNGVEIWDRWLTHSAALVVTTLLPEIEPEPFTCPQCDAVADTFYGMDNKVCKSCWTTNHPETAVA